MAQFSDYMAPKDVAADTGLSVERIRQLMTGGRLAHVQTALGRLVPRYAVEELKRQREERELARTA